MVTAAGNYYIFFTFLFKNVKDFKLQLGSAMADMVEVTVFIH